MKQKKFYTEFAYVLGIVLLAIGTALMEKADWGLSTVVAPAYILFLKLQQTFSFLTFGTMEYLFQLALLVVMIPVLRMFRISWLFSFVTAVLYGLALDGFMALFGSLPAETFLWQGAWFVLGMVICAMGVAFFFRSYLAPEVYELFVKELARKTGTGMGKVKWIYDICSCVFAIAMSFCFFGLWEFQGIGWGTAVVALVNGHIITFVGKLMDRHLQMTDLLPLRKFFEAGQQS